MFEKGQYLNDDVHILDCKSEDNNMYYKIQCDKCGFNSNMKCYKKGMLLEEYYWLKEDRIVSSKYKG